MTLLDRVHGSRVHPHRVRALSSVLTGLIPPGASVLDVGAGDGRIGQMIASARPDVELSAIDRTVRKETVIPVREFDGRVIPFPDRSWDVVMLLDVLHHAEQPRELLREAARVSRRSVLVKDHLLQGRFARPVLSFMDWVGNRRHGVTLPYSYWTRERWLDEFGRLHLDIAAWNDRLALYPPPLRWVFERDLHFVAQLDLHQDIVR